MKSASRKARTALLALCLVCSGSPALAVHVAIGDRLPAITATAVDGRVFEFASPGEGVTAILFDRGSSPRTPDVSDLLRAVLGDERLREKPTRLVWVAAKGSEPGMIPASVRGVTRDLLVINDGDGELFERFGVVVQPTVVICDSAGRVGYAAAALGLRNRIEIESAALLAAGVIDEAEFGRRLSEGAAPAESEEVDRATSLARLAVRIADHGMIEGATRRLREALELDPVNEEALAGMGHVALLTKNTDEAERWYTALLARNAGSNAGALGLARVRVMQGDERIDEAIGLCRTVIERDPQSAEAYDVLGQAHQQQGNDEEATKCFHRRDELLAASGDQHNP
ncbi:MAG: hypothetical protein H6814_03105 [Phycisphaeraceae bacterium]|nr:hypothetical protein [Phycisphaeraceae bacterium]